jgi:hypothetical protein
MPTTADYKIKTMEEIQTKEEFRTEKKVKVKEFDEKYIDIVPYNDSVIGETDETTYENYINLHGQMYPEILESMKDGIHKMEDAERYIEDFIRNKYKNSNRNVAAVASNTVFALLVNYYMSPVVEEQVKILPKQTFTPSAYTPRTPEQIEEDRKRREKEEAERKEKARLEMLRKKQEEANKHFAGSLFGF